MKVYVLIDRGQFCGVFSTPEKAKNRFNFDMEVRGIKITWEDCGSSGGYWMVSKESKVGKVEVLQCPVHI